MKKMTRNELLERLADYGYELHRPDSAFLNGEETLLNLAGEKDGRLLEGFPVVFEGVLRKQGQVRWDATGRDWRKALSEDANNRLLQLVFVTHGLFKRYGESPEKLRQVESALQQLSKNWRPRLKEFEKKFDSLDSVRVGGGQAALSTERLKNQYQNYVAHKNADKASLPVLDIELEVMLSKFFAPKQKEVLKKRLNREKLSKTEREYFYRVVNKRLKALANEKLHEFVKSMCQTQHI